jgi:predicted transcriptional regulator of viral defense system
MRMKDINKTDKLFWTIEDIANELSINIESARVTANRYVKQGFLIRVKRNFYLTAEKLNNPAERKLFQLANLIQIPSYISLTSAMSFYNISTQQLQGTVESIAQKRTKLVKVKEIEFRYFLVKKNYYSGFSLEKNIFIAKPEKAIADIVYLSSLGKYNCDFAAIDFSKIDKTQVNRFLNSTNKRTKKYWEKLCRHYRI